MPTYYAAAVTVQLRKCPLPDTLTPNVETCANLKATQNSNDAESALSRSSPLKEKPVTCVGDPTNSHMSFIGKHRTTPFLCVAVNEQSWPASILETSKHQQESRKHLPGLNGECESYSSTYSYSDEPSTFSSLSATPSHSPQFPILDTQRPMELGPIRTSQNAHDIHRLQAFVPNSVGFHEEIDPKAGRQMAEGSLTYRPSPYQRNFPSPSSNPTLPDQNPLPIPEALNLMIKLDPKRTFGMPGPGHPARDIKIEVLYNGQLSYSNLVSSRNKNDPKYCNSCVAGVRSGVRVEIPWLLLTNTKLYHEASNSIQLNSYTEYNGAVSRWQELSAAIMKEARSRCPDLNEPESPTADYLHNLAKMPMPAEVQHMQRSHGLKFGIIDVIVCSGTGKKYPAQSGYMTEPLRLIHPSFTKAVTVKTDNLPYGRSSQTPHTVHHRGMDVVPPEPLQYTRELSTVHSHQGQNACSLTVRTYDPPIQKRKKGDQESVADQHDEVVQNTQHGFTSLSTVGAIPYFSDTNWQAKLLLNTTSAMQRLSNSVCSHPPWAPQYTRSIFQDANAGFENRSEQPRLGKIMDQMVQDTGIYSRSVSENTNELPIATFRASGFSNRPPIGESATNDSAQYAQGVHSFGYPYYPNTQATLTNRSSIGHYDMRPDSATHEAQQAYVAACPNYRLANVYSEGKIEPVFDQTTPKHDGSQFSQQFNNTISQDPSCSASYPFQVLQSRPILDSTPSSWQKSTGTEPKGAVQATQGSTVESKPKRPVIKLNMPQSDIERRVKSSMVDTKRASFNNTYQDNAPCSSSGALNQEQSRRNDNVKRQKSNLPSRLKRKRNKMNIHDQTMSSRQVPVEFSVEEYMAKSTNGSSCQSEGRARSKQSDVSVDTATTSEKLDLSKGCVATLSDGYGRRQIKAERTGEFKESEVILGVRFIVGA